MVERVTITIKKDLLRRIDGMIDKREIRSRSHAIESLLAKSLSKEGINTAIVMAGEGTKRNTLPKALSPINGIPILEHQINMLRRNGIDNLVIASDYTTEQIRSRFGNGRAYGVTIQYITEDRPMGTAGAIGLAHEMIDGSFVMLNADTLMDPNIYEIYDFHKRHKKLATVMLTTTDDPSHFGVVKMRGNDVLKFVEKPKPDRDTSRLVNAGLCIFEKKVAEMVRGKLMIEELFNRLCRDSQLAGFVHDGKTIDIGTPSGMERAKGWNK
jgi:NDP-sugar pyrophosphorylase family protein